MPKRYDEEFRRDAVKLVREGGVPIARAAAELGISDWTLNRWFRACEGVDSDPTVETEHQELVRLRGENRELRMERDILKKATAYFARNLS